MKLIPLLSAGAAIAVLAGCAPKGTEPRAPGVRTYRMGFSSLPPRLTIQEVLRTVDSVSQHSDAALLVVEIPWAALLADTNPALLIRREHLELVQLYGRRGMPVVATLDPANGLNRAAEAERSAARSRSPPCRASTVSMRSPSTASCGPHTSRSRWKRT